MKRIVKETLKNGNIQYRVETNTFIGIKVRRWFTDSFYDAERDCNYDAVFDTLEKAQKHCGCFNNDIIKREIVWQ